MSTSIGQTAREAVQDNLLEFLAKQTKSVVALDQDLFESGLVSSLFAMELVVYLESTFGIAITGVELKLDHFRTVIAMTELVLRLRGAGSDD